MPAQIVSAQGALERAPLSASVISVGAGVFASIVAPIVAGALNSGSDDRATLLLRSVASVGWELPATLPSLGPSPGGPAHSKFSQLSPSLSHLPQLFFPFSFYFYFFSSHQLWGLIL